MRKDFKRKSQFFRINHQISAKTVRLIDETGKQIGVMEMGKALGLSGEKGLDLVEIAANAQPPVVKLIDYSKFLYQLKKKKKEEKKGAKVAQTKEIRLGLFIGKHDLEIKLKRAREFLQNGDKVRFVVRFAGRAITKQDLGRALFEKIISNLGEIAKVEREIHMEGRQMVTILSRIK